MQFVNDPLLKDLSPVGSGAPTLVAPRTQAGEAYSWAPGGDAQALVDFIGPHKFVSVGGQVYERQLSGSLEPFDVKREFVVVRPPAGEPFFLTAAEYKEQFARVDPGFWMSPVDETAATLTPESFHKFVATISVPRGTDVMGASIREDEDSASTGTAPISIAVGSDAQGEPESVQPDSAPPAAVKRPPGRPKGSTNKPKAAV